ncbi:efflux RND transporter periplasmic adaptor subunit [Flammeovirga sp. SubArs3]|uniref:efflux RND transporter periplasmic adaptor subunit n=1 Tax=Flammeovirga sp. SubArs3 TaxID=2995316 RepID=UPI00248C0D5C|nr:efflux RND transporter periplasmic adaptor subunit [Flammeovirga sp. SubArs3]
MKKTFISLSLILTFLMGCQKEQEITKVEADQTKPAFLLKTEEVTKKLSIPAEVLPFDQATLHAKMEGYISQLKVDIGDKVKKGQVLLVLDAPEINAQYVEAKAKYMEAKANYEGSKDAFLRIEKASKTDGVIAESERITAKNKMLADESLMKSTKASINAYGQLLSYLTIKAPFDGIITERFVNVGDFAGISSQDKLLTIESVDTMRVRVYVPESYINFELEENQLVFTTDALVGKELKAKLSRKSGSIDKETRTELWEFTYENTAHLLKPGMYTMGELSLKRKSKSFVVPSTAVVTAMEKQFVVKSMHEKVEWIEVKQGITNNNKVEIFGELKEGDILLVRGSEELKPGTSLKVALK